MKREIGGEFWTVETTPDGTRVHEAVAPLRDARFFLSGRFALAAILREPRFALPSFRVAALPSWCCDSMIAPFVESGFEIKFYSARLEDGRFVMDMSEADDCDVALEMSYFGYAVAPSRDFRRRPRALIRDVTHSLFSDPYALSLDDADYAFGSLRKWSGFATGGFALGISSSFEDSATDEEYVATRRRAAQMKARYIAGETDDKSFLSTFADAEARLDPPFATARGGADPECRSLALRFDVDRVKSRRRANASVLLRALSHRALFPLGENDCPLFVPIVLPRGERDALKRFLIERRIYCPTHWPLDDLHGSLPTSCRAIYESELSVVCDQRYDEEDMERIASAITEFEKGV